MEKPNYFLIGIISTILIGAITGLIIWKSSLLGRQSGIELIGRFESVDGLIENAVVKYRGFPIGYVKSIVPNPSDVEVRFFIDPNYPIPSGSTLRIIFDGLIGEKYLTIIPNSDSSEMVLPHSVLTGSTSAELATFIDKGAKNLDTLNNILLSLSDLFMNPTLQLEYQATALEIQSIIKNINHISDQLAKISKTNLVSTIDGINRILINLDRIMSDRNYDKIEKTLTNIETLSRSLSEITDDDQLKTGLFSTLEETKSIFKRSNNFFDFVSQVKINTPFTLMYNDLKTDPYYFYSLDVHIYLKSSLLSFGFGNYTKKNELLDVMFGTRFFDSVLFQYGLIKKQIGLGFTYYMPFLPSLQASTKIYDVNDPKVDVKLHYYLNRFIGFSSGIYTINKASRSMVWGISIQSEP